MSENSSIELAASDCRSTGMTQQHACGVKPTDKVQLPEKARAGIEVLHQVVESLLTTSRYVDEEGEATHALCDLLSCIADPPFKLNDALGVPSTLKRLAKEVTRNGGA